MFSVDYVDLTFMQNVSAKYIERKFSRVRDIMEKFLNEEYVRFSSEINDFICRVPKKSYNLANLLFKNKINSTIKPLCANRAYEIYCKGALIASFWEVSDEIFNIISKNVEGNFRATLSRRSRLVQLYRFMYSPLNVGEFEMRETLFYDGENTGVRLGAEHSLKSLPEIAFKNEVFVGNVAFEYFTGEKLETQAQEIISCNIQETLATIAEKYDIESETITIPILSDFTFSRTRVSTKGRDIYYIYNAAEYELIPFIANKIRIGTIFVVARFILVNVWIIKILMYRKKIFIDTGKKLIKSLSASHDRLIAEPVHQAEIIPDPSQYYGINQHKKNIFSGICDNEISYTPHQKNKLFDVK